ncbi:monocarboxylate transporter 13-like [Asterias amurensis]|uniref:monocarboxylate transporter 13-like n=1 Tax=Asterias amurensis TaxID=7602 RepID=UPI003AB3DF41
MTEKSYCKLPMDGGKDEAGTDNNTRQMDAAKLRQQKPAVAASTKITDKEKWRFCLRKLRRPGWKWVVLIGAFVIRGTLNGFLSNYTTLSVKLRESFGSSEELTGWVGSVLLTLRSIASPLSTVVVVKIGYRTTIFLGILTCSCSLMISSFIQDLRWYFVTLSLMCGIGMSLSTFCAYDYLMSYFHKQFIRGSGMMALASSLGLMVFAPSMESLLESIGLENTLRIFAGLFLFISVFAFSFRPSPAERRRMSVIQLPIPPGRERLPSDPGDLKVFQPLEVYKPPVHQKKTFTESMSVYAHLLKSADMWILGLISLIICLASTFTYLNMVSFLKSIGLSVKTSAFTLSMMGVGEFGGTALSTVLGDRIPLLKVEILATACLVASVATAGLTVVHVYSGVLVVVIVIGFCRSLYNMLIFPSVIETMGKGRKLEACSISSVMCGIGYLPGGIIGGALYDATGDYTASLWVCASLYFISVLLLVWCSYRSRHSKKLTDKNSAMMNNDGKVESFQERDYFIVENIITTV